MTTPLTNWAGNVTFGAAALHRPASVDELAAVVAGSSRLRALGTAHSFNRLADTTGDLVSTAGLPRVMDIDAAASTVTVTSGIRYGELAEYLHNAGYALHNLGSLPHISVAGACATGTHGSGPGNGNLATAVAGLEMVRADGELVRLDRTDADFPGAVIALGALGIATTLTVDVQPTYDMRQYVYDGLPFDAAVDHFADIMSSAYSVSLFTDWRGPRINQVWVKQRMDARGLTVPADSWFGARLADGPRHPLDGMPVANCTQQLGVPGPWQERLPHFRMEFTPSAGDELQSEFIIAASDAAAALRSLNEIADQIAPVLQITEIRTIAADDLWLSPSYQRDSVAVHFTWIADADAVAPVLALIEARLEPFQARPHWGKLFTTTPEIVTEGYERFTDFVALAGAYDPTGKFRNEMLERYLSQAHAD